MFQTVRGVTTLFIGIAFLMLGNGLQGSLLAVRATLEEFGTGVTGTVMSAYYLGFLISSIATPRMVTEVGYIRVFAAFASIASAAVLVHAMAPYPVVWFGLRFFSGFAIAGLYVVCESWLNQTASNEERGKVFSIYMIIVAACMGAGQFLLPLADPGGYALFVITSIFVSIALVPISLSRTPAPTVVALDTLKLKELFKLSPLGFVGCFMIGLIQGGVFSLGPVYATEIGFNTAQIALFMALPFFLSIFIQFPVGAISDKMDRRNIILVIGVLGGASAGLVVYFGIGQIQFVYGFFALYVACSMLLYGLVIAHANDAMPYEKILPATAMLVLVYSVGSFVGPLLAGYVMEQFGSDWLMLLGIIINGGLVVYTAYRMSQRAATPEEERGEYVPVIGRTTGVATVAAIEAAGEEGGWLSPDEDPSESDDDGDGDRKESPDQ